MAQRLDHTELLLMPFKAILYKSYPFARQRPQLAPVKAKRPMHPIARLSAKPLLGASLSITEDATRRAKGYPVDYVRVPGSSVVFLF